MIRAVLFDLDETLHDRSRSLDQFIRHQYQAFHSQLETVPPEVWKSRFIELDQNGYVPKETVYPRLIREFGLNARVCRSLLEHYYQQFYLFAEPMRHHEILAVVRKAGFRTGIITNGRTDFQRKVIGKLGLEKWMEICLVSEQEKVRKPDRRIFHKAAESLGIHPHECLFVGDHPLNDIVGAQDAGMKTAWITRGKPWPVANRRPNHVIRDLLELKAILFTSDPTRHAGRTRTGP